MKKSEYAEAGVDYTEAEVLRDALKEMGRHTLEFPKRWDVHVNKRTVGIHGAIYGYHGPYSHSWTLVGESLGNQNWIAEWMYQHTGEIYYDVIGWNFPQIIIVDVLAQGAMPAIFVDIISANNYGWGMDERRRKDFINGLYKACRTCGMALPAGDSSALKFLVNSLPPVKSAPVLTGCIAGIIAPIERAITGENLQPGDHIIAAASSGVHMNGLSLVIERALSLKDKFLHELPNGNTLGAEALIPAICYVDLIEALLRAGINIHALLPGTGSGLSKIAFDSRQYTYHIKNWWKWDDIPPLFQFMKELGVTMDDLLTTFNMKGGYYIYVPAEEVPQVIRIGKKAGYELMDVGVVEKGKRKIIIDAGLFGPESIILPPPGE